LSGTPWLDKFLASIKIRKKGIGTSAALFSAGVFINQPAVKFT
jgi:hypothetical protein